MTGRDLGQLSSDLQSQLGVTKRRANFIAVDQSNKATAALTRARQVELGITHAQWQHSASSKHPRRTHVQASKDKVQYKISEGWFDPDPKVQRHILPSELVQCKCSGRPIIKGFS